MGGIAKAIGGIFGLGATAPKTVATPVVDQAAAMDAANQQTADDLRRRRGAAATALTGPTGAEATTPGAKTLLGQ